jgi:hypothetical protein
MPNNDYKPFFPDHRRTPEAEAAARERFERGELPIEPWEAGMRGYKGFQTLVPLPEARQRPGMLDL